MPLLRLLALCLVLTACSPGTMTPMNPAGAEGYWRSVNSDATAQAQAQATALPVTQSYLDGEYAKSLTATFVPPALTATAVSNRSTQIANDLFAERATGEALDRANTYSVTLEAFEVLRSDTQKRIAENNAGIARNGILTDGSEFLCFGFAGVIVFGFFAFVLIALRQVQLWLDGKRRVNANRMWRQLATDYRPRIAAPVGYQPPPPANLSRESRIRGMLKTYVRSCVELERGGVDHPFSRPNALTHSLITRPDNGEVWQEGHKRAIDALSEMGVVGKSGQGGKVALLVDLDRALVIIDTAPLPRFADPIPAAKIVLAGSQVGHILASSQV